MGLYLKEDAASATFLVHTSWAAVNAALHTYYGAPSDAWLQLTVPRSAEGPVVGDLQVYGKTATRLPEGLYLRFNVSAAVGAKWTVGKLGGSVDPFDVVPGGNHHQHGYSEGLTAGAGGGVLAITSQDFGLTQFGKPIPLPAPVWANATSVSEGASFLLIDNTWGTNYPAWVPWRDGEENMRWRFAIERKYIDKVSFF